MGLSVEEIQKTYERYKWHIDYFPQREEELLKALKDLWSVRSTPFTDEQAYYKFKIECKAEEIIKKYD